MKKLPNTLESLLDADFDINIEPLDIPKLSHETLMNDLMVPVLTYNGVVVCYGPYHKALDDMQKYIDFVEGAQFMDSDAKDLSNKFSNMIQNINKNMKNSWLSEKTYKVAQESLDRFRKILPAIVELDKICDTVAKKYHIKKFGCQPDDRWNWRTVDIWFTKSQKPSEDVAEQFMTEVADLLGKVKGIIVANSSKENIEIKFN